MKQLFIIYRIIASIIAIINIIIIIEGNRKKSSTKPNNPQVNCQKNPENILWS